MKVLKSLNKMLPNVVEKKSVVKASVDDSAAIIEKLQERIDYLQSWLNSVLLRTPEIRELEVNLVIERLEKISASQLTYYVLDNFGHKYFKNECDTEFKIRLAQAILDHVRLYYPSYKNELLESIADNNSEYAANYIYMEKF